jgi:Arc/MetJ-type ribon-helix-helix transcriptional regulator
MRGVKRMAMKTVQIRLTEEQLRMIDEKIKEGKYPNRSEAIRDYVRRAELWELFSRFLDLTEKKPISIEKLEQTREKVYQEFIEPRLKQQQATAKKGGLKAR